MARITINLGTPPSGTDGDPVRTAFEKVNTMTKELYEKDASLGTAATRNVISSKTDNTDGRILNVGAFGWNGGNSITMPQTANANDLQVSGVYLFSNGGINVPPGAPFPHIAVYMAATGYSTQVAMDSAGNGYASRVQVAGTWRPWVNHYTSANSFMPVASGGLLESGGTATNTYTKMGDGSMTASMSISKPAINTNQAQGSLFYSNDLVAATAYASGFIEPPEVSVYVISDGYGAVIAGSTTKGTAGSTPRIVLMSPRVYTCDCTIQITARGKWKK